MTEYINPYFNNLKKEFNITDDFRSSLFNFISHIINSNKDLKILFSNLRDIMETLQSSDLSEYKENDNFKTITQNATNIIIHLRFDIKKDFNSSKVVFTYVKFRLK